MVPPPNAQVTVRAPAKVNLLLEVGPRRDDGFHDLVTVFQALSVYEEVTAAPAAEFSITVEGVDGTDVADVPLDGTNLALRAARLLAERGGVDEAVALHVRKGVPVAGGMAGGSADAAAAVVACDRLGGLHTPDDVLLRLAAGLGSDVPFSVVGGTARGRGRGEVVEPLEDTASWWWVAVPASTGLSTPEVYRHFDRLHPDAPEEPPSAEPLLDALASGEPLRLARALHNDLQEAAIDLRPELGDLVVRGEAAGALRGLVSGSGPTVVFLCESADGAHETGVALAAAGHDVVLTATGPVAGAHVLV